MVKLSLSFVFLALSSYAYAAGTTCTFKTVAQVNAGKAKCDKIVLDNIVVPAKTTLDLTGLRAGTQVVFSGKTTFGFAPWSKDNFLIAIDGTRITVTETPGSVIDCGGERWWDGKGSNGGTEKPKFFSAHKLTDSHIGPLHIKNTPIQAFSINGVNGLTLDGINMDNSLGDVKGGHNTDAFDIGSSTGVFITNAVVKNQDDCLAVNSGKNILFSNGDCSGGHGLSIGSVGGRSDNTVDGVRIEHSRISNSDNGVRIKSVEGAKGLINNVTYTDITLSNIAKYGIDIQQDYQNGGPSGTPTNGVKITNININNVKGSVASKATPIYLLCGEGSCTNWKWSGNSISGGVPKPNSCKNFPKPASC
ncbi:uncharacterized protein PFL1_03318 [Pseudozyma flocculosa PF-1]|uniref:endo-polygalacturonase n=2 Tax=Pseudozyma flocculosa TaxID=84751 RepID=A0A5C3F6K6_9BASI|nr:uncharacterized protein PFL1_03318 [Pseudozyma flocculosa PF-1]EPQ29028.1 hypothetical protein PFL1_03318 [Pseudozyma flocculosa PF-1]SPO40022.1 probable PGU1 - Endo-polygalacturonase [Pseudozyma flocculosa]